MDLVNLGAQFFFTQSGTLVLSLTLLFLSLFMLVRGRYLSLHFLSLTFLCWAFLPLDNPSSLVAMLVIFLSPLFLLYFHLYGRRPIPYSLPSLFFFSLHLLTPFSLLWGFSLGLSLDKLPLGEISELSLLRHLLLFLLIPILFLYPFLQPFLPSLGVFTPGGSLHPRDSLYQLWKGNPRADDFISWFILFLGKNPSLRLPFLAFHFLLLHLLPFFHSLLWLKVFLSWDLLILFRALPLLLISFLYGHVSHYFLVYVESNFQEMDNLLGKELGDQEKPSFFFLREDYPPDFLPFFLDHYHPLRELREKLHHPLFLLFPPFHFLSTYVLSSSEFAGYPPLSGS